MWWIISIALALRLINLNQSLWLDEAIQALALMGRLGPLMTYALADFQPPLYHAIGWLWTSLAGYSELALRTPSLIAGLGTVYFVIRIGQHLGGHKLSMIAGVLVATNPLLIYYSQEGRTYALTTFLVTASMYYFLSLLQKKSTSRYILYSVFTVMFLWTSYLTWFLHALIFIYTLILKRRDLVIIQLWSVSTLLFWLPSLLSSLGIGISTLSTSPEWGSVVGGVSLKALALTWVKAMIGRISIDPSWLYGAVVAALAIIHAYIISKSKKLVPILYIWLLTILVVALVALILPVYSYTRLLFVVPAYLLLLSLGLLKLSLRYTLIVTIAQLTALVYFWITPTFHREDWRSLAADFGSHATYALPSRNQSAPLLYYGIPDKQIIEPKVGLRSSPSKIVYIKYVEDIFDGAQVGRANLESSGYTVTAQKVYPGLQVGIYENNN